jgi:methyltransferase (TIGR00027 family)
VTQGDLVLIHRRQFLRSIAAGLGSFCSLDAIALQPGEPSRTAQGTALQRAAHQLLERPLVFDDPFALRILGAQRVKWLGSNIARYETPGSRAMRAFLVMRSRYAEDELARAHGEGTTQYVVLGAGLDTYAYRNPHGRRLRVFEVDHPSTQAWKRRQLREQGIDLPRWLTFVSVDFEKDSLGDRLHRAGFRRAAPAFISWLGVTMYLTEDAVMQTLRFVAQSCARGTEIVFDFALPDEALGEAERTARAKWAQRVAQIGEPWISHFDPISLARQLTDTGFSEAGSLGATEANARYFADRTDGFRLRGSGRIMSARV